jgi:hypothetical protein
MPTCSSTCLLEMIRVHQNGQMHPLFDMSDDRRLSRNLVHQTHTQDVTLLIPQYTYRATRTKEKKTETKS